MQSNEPIELDDLIEFFKTERDKFVQSFHSDKDESKFRDTEFLSLLAILMSISIVLLNIDKIVGYILIIGYLTLFVVYKFKTNKKRQGDDINYYKKIIRCDMVIEFLQYLKISHIEVDLSPLLANIEQLFWDRRALNVKEDYEIIWTDDVIDSLDIINNKRIANENPMVK